MQRCKGTPAVDRGLLEEKSDFYFLGRGLSGIRNLFETGRNRGKTLARVFAFTITYNLAAITLCLAGLMNPLLAAIVMPLSSVISISSVIIQTKVREGRTSPKHRREEPVFMPPVALTKTPAH